MSYVMAEREPMLGEVVSAFKALTEAPNTRLLVRALAAVPKAKQSEPLSQQLGHVIVAALLRTSDGDASNPNAISFSRVIVNGKPSDALDRASVATVQEAVGLVGPLPTRDQVLQNVGAFQTAARKTTDQASGPRPSAKIYQFPLGGRAPQPA